MCGANSGLAVIAWSLWPASSHRSRYRSHPAGRMDCSTYWAFPLFRYLYWWLLLYNWVYASTHI